LNITGDSTVQLNGCTFLNNSAQFSGGAIELQAGAQLTAQTSLFRSNVTNGPAHAAGAKGGAMHILNASATIYNSLFDSNQAPAVGGAIAMEGESNQSGASLLCSNCSFTKNGALRDPSNPTP